MLICSASAYLYTILHVFWGYGDEGLVLYGSQLVLEGVLPYRGFFEVFGPGSFYWTGFFFKLFGIDFSTARTLLLFTGVTLVLLPMWMTRGIHLGPFELLPAVFLLLISIPIGLLVPTIGTAIYFCLFLSRCFYYSKTPINLSIYRWPEFFQV